MVVQEIAAPCQRLAIAAIHSLWKLLSSGGHCPDKGRVAAHPGLNYLAQFI